MAINNQDFEFKNKYFEAHLNTLMSQSVLEDNLSLDNVAQFFLEKLAPLVKQYDLQKDDLLALGPLKKRVMAMVSGTGPIMAKPQQTVAVQLAPIGIPNATGKDCWANSLWQILASASSIKEKLKNTSFGTDFNNYAKAQQNGQRQVSLNAQEFRRFLGFYPKTLEDAGEALRKLLQSIGFTHDTTPLIELGIEKGNPLNLQKALNNDGFNQSPQDLFFHVSRNNSEKIDKSGIISRLIWGPNFQTEIVKNEESVEVPQLLQLPKDGSLYGLEGCIIHTGKDNESHYVSMKRVGTNWYLIDDSVVHQITSTIAEENLKKGSIFHYQKIADSSTVQQASTPNPKSVRSVSLVKQPEQVAPTPKSKVENKSPQSESIFALIAHTIMSIVQSFFAFFLGDSKKTA